MSTAALDTFTAEILRSFLVSTVREMVATTTRTAYSTCFAHGEDFTCALFDAQGRMVAQDQGVAVHAGSLGDAVRHVIEVVDDFGPDDVVVHNDPYNFGTHQADGLVCRPIYVHARLLGYAVNRGHWSDIGGMSPGGWSGAALDSVQEGLTIPAVRVVRAGVVQSDIRELLLRNVRLPVQLWGDIQAQIASNIVAERRMRTLAERYGIDGVEAAMESALAYSRRRFHKALEVLPDGVAEASDYMEDDATGGGPHEIRVRISKSGTRVHADFGGTAPQVASPVNSTLACTKAAVVGALIATCDPELPLNEGVFECIEVAAPAGSMVNPTFPAPTFGATADPGDRVSETVLKALAQLAPERVPAGSYATGNNATGGGVDDEGRPFLWYSYQSGGCGAYHGHDGNAAEWHLMANSKNESMEVWEARYPVEFLSYELVQDSGGAGRWRGGLGTERCIRVLTATRLSAISDHHRTGATGAAGGLEGAPNGFFVERDGDRRSVGETFGLRSPSKFANLELEAGDVFVTLQGGGGGYGEPGRRPAEEIERDVSAGYVSEGAARRDYGWTADQ